MSDKPIAEWELDLLCPSGGGQEGCDHAAGICKDYRPALVASEAFVVPLEDPNDPSADEWARLDAANADTDAMAGYVPKEKVRDVVEFLRSRSKDEAIGTADTRWAYMRAANCVADTLLPEDRS